MSKPEFSVDIEAKTVTHNPTGIVFDFVLELAGSWYGESRVKPTSGSADAMAAIARRAGEAWIEAISAI
ncbi:hypothetical protein GC170_20425 [bacterium]|nr:hypothetical protein [bacterium]